jgi:hypothetical protein
MNRCAHLVLRGISSGYQLPFANQNAFESPNRLFRFETV